MNRQTFKVLKEAHKNNVNPEELRRIKWSEQTPLITNHVNLFLNNTNRNVNVKFSNIVSKFSSLENTSAYKDELVITYLLFLGKILNNTLLSHMFFVPQSQSIFNWILLYKRVVYSIITLIYNKRFTDEDWLYLDDMVYQLNEGSSNSVRTFLKQIRVLSISNEPVEMETKYADLLYITSDDFGPFYWRMLHFMAEAINLRKNAVLAKSIWKEFTIYSLHRTLLCSLCQNHYKNVVEKYSNELQNTSNYSNLWFDIHNYVNKFLNKFEYSKSEFEKDQSIMQNLLTTNVK